METTFQTLKTDYASAFGTVIPAGSVFFQTKKYGTVLHASPTRGQGFWSYNTTISDLEPSSDRDLLKLWNHATIERKYGVYASKPLLQNELESRGYILTDNKHRWKKSEIAA